jgi:hypothetical protein
MSLGGALAAIRPDEWNLPLLIHVLGAMILVGGIVTTATAQFLGWRRPAPNDALSLARVASRALLFVAIPGWIVMRIGAEWIASEEGLEGERLPDWVDVGYVTADLGGGLLLVATLLAWFASWRLGRSGAASAWPTRISSVLVTVALVGYLVAVWAMTSKPS